VAEALRKNQALRTLSIEANDGRDEGAKSLSSTLGANTCLTNLVLDTNNISAPGATSLSQALERNKTLGSLSLQGNPLGSDGGCEFARVLGEHNSTLQKLNMGSTDLDPRAFEAMAKALRGPVCGLRLLGLSRNKPDDRSALQLIHALSRNANLEELELAKCGLTAEGVAQIVQAAMSSSRLKRLDTLHNQGGASPQLMAERLADVTRNR